MAPERLRTAVLEILTVDQVSELLNVKPATIRSWVFHRRIPFLKIGGLVRFDRRDIDAMLADARHPAIDASTLAERIAG